jgi:23S rRNA (guanosine2251-2'-O)-methyltransferase
MNQKQPKNRELIVILYNIRSAENVGSIFRTSDAFGVSHVYLVGYTPSPIDKYGRPRKDVTKTALGAEKIIPWTKVKNIKGLVLKLKKNHFKIISLEQDVKARDFKKVLRYRKIALIVGNEVTGISKDILNISDYIAEIPMRGKLLKERSKSDGHKESLNVAVSLGIAVSNIEIKN